MTTDTLPHGMGWRPPLPDHRDYQLVDHRPDLLTAVSLPSMMDLRSMFLPIEDQGQEGACTAFGSLAAAEAIQKKSGVVQFKGSKQAQYWLTRYLEGTTANDVGASVRDAARAIALYGMGHSSLYEYVAGQYAQQPPQAVLDDAKKNLAVKYIAVPNETTQIKTVVAAGYPVIIGFSVYQNFPMSAGIDLVPMPQGGIVGGHCVVIVGYNDADDTWLCRNSWGTGWGNQGYFRLPYAYLPIAARDFWLIDTMSGTPVPGPTPNPTPTPVVTKTHQVDVYSDGSMKVVL